MSTLTGGERHTQRVFGYKHRRAHLTLDSARPH